MQSNKTNLHFPLQLRALKRASKDVSAEKKANRVRGNERASALRVLDLLPAMKPFFSAENKQNVVLRRNASSRNDRRWPYAYSQRKDRERESACSLVCSERGVRLRSLLFLSHTPPPLIFSEGIPPSLPCCLTALSLSSCVTSSGIRPRRGEILQLAAWQLSLAPPPLVFFSLCRFDSVTCQIFIALSTEALNLLYGRQTAATCGRCRQIVESKGNNIILQRHLWQILQSLYKSRQLIRVIERKVQKPFLKEVWWMLASLKKLVLVVVNARVFRALTWLHKPYYMSHDLIFST